MVTTREVGSTSFDTFLCYTFVISLLKKAKYLAFFEKCESAGFWADESWPKVG